MATAVACGGAEDPLVVHIDSTSRALFPGLTQARVGLFAKEADCAIIRLSGPKTAGIYNQEIQFTGGEQIVESEISSIVAGTYRLAIWGFSGSTPIAFGCAPERIEIENGKQTAVGVTLGVY